MTSTWVIAVDWDRKGNFDDSFDNITDQVISANWFVGMKQPYQDIAHDSVLQLVLKNDDRRFSPENSTSPIYGKLVPFRPMIVQANDGSVVRTMWKGWIERIQPNVNQYGERRVEIVAAGPMQFMKAADTAIPLQENQLTSDIIVALLEEVVIPPALVGIFILDFSQIGLTTILPNLSLYDGDPDSLYSDIDEGIQTLAIAADNWVKQGSTSERDTFNVYKAIQAVAAAERGRFLFGRDGKPIFWNRHHTLYTVAAAATFDDSMQGLDYVYGAPEELSNEIVVVCHPRTISPTASEILWELEDEIRISVDQERKVTARYRDDAGNRIGGRDVYVDGVVFSKGSGTVTITPKANSAELLVINTGSEPAKLTGCTVKGEKITDFGRLEASAEDNWSITRFGRRTHQMNLPAVDNFQDAQNIANFELMRRAEPRGSVRQLQLVSHGLQGGGHHAQQLELTLGDKITVGETQTGHDNSYYIIGEAHRLSKGATLFETQWYLEPITSTFWELGVSGRSNLPDAPLENGSTILAY